ncbi:MAG: hypothetical protein HY922_01120, partial [Elusimicrobia bacterium]|nr:hypothetical protein [Elusimicrobiota bacterium]
SVLDSPSSWSRFFYDPNALTIDRAQARIRYRPLTGLSYGLNRLLGGDNPFWHHLPSLLLHSAITCLVFALAADLYGSVAAAWAAGLLFCLHPAQVESVAYISGSRANQLSLLFCLIAFSCWRRGRRRRALAAFAAALLSKESSFFLLPVIAAYDVVYGNDPRWKPRLLRWAPFAAMFAAYWALRAAVLGQAAQRGLWGEGLGSHLSLAVHGISQDIANALWPARLRSCYSFLEGPHFVPVAAGLAFLLLILCAGSLWLALQRQPDGFASVWFLAALLPVSNIVPVDALAADRFLYAPLVGLALLSACLLAGPLSKLKPRVAVLALAGSGLLLALRAMEEQQAWQSAWALDLHAYAVAPEDPCTAVNLASHYYNWGMLPRAQELLRQARRPGAPKHIIESADMVEALIRTKHPESVGLVRPVQTP